MTLSELELRIRRSVVFAKSGKSVTTSASNCLALTYKLVTMRQGNLDEIIDAMNEFNRAFATAHAELLRE